MSIASQLINCCVSLHVNQKTDFKCKWLSVECRQNRQVCHITTVGPQQLVFVLLKMLGWHIMPIMWVKSMANTARCVCQQMLQRIKGLSTPHQTLCSQFQFLLCSSLWLKTLLTHNTQGCIGEHQMEYQVIYINAEHVCSHAFSCWFSWILFMECLHGIQKVHTKGRASWNALVH